MNKIIITIIMIIAFMLTGMLTGCNEDSQNNHKTTNINYVDVIADYMETTPANFTIDNIEQVNFADFEMQGQSQCVSIEITLNNKPYGFVFHQEHLICYEDFENEFYIVYSAHSPDSEIYNY